MAKVQFTPNLQRHLDCPAVEVVGDTVKQLLEAVFVDNPKLRSYILDDRGAVRKHMVIFLNGEAISDRETLSDPVEEHAEVFVFQALSGG